ncbi:hypothetical protein SteCoe_16076 [Stentor coeruleus]|uniref:Uncharacterized protein n=1 Tax=Stentor coeruleus TaxID=5963 RepID=A0A1R2C229_9CILI|nr:hypothetical protein SteCoe_16076 [Stentor coeruleus]
MKARTQKIDTNKTRALLCSYIEDLSLNFLEKRARDKCYKENVLEELQDVIEVLIDREKDLKSTAEMALSILDNNEKLKLKNSKVKSKLIHALDKTHHQSIEIQTLQESLISSETRYEETSKALAETEEIMLLNSAELNRIHQEHNSQSKTTSNDEDFDLIKKEYQLELESLQKKNSHLLKDYKTINELFDNNNKELNQLKIDYSKLESRYAKLQENYKESEKSRDFQSEKIEKLDNDVKTLSSKCERLQSLSDRLEEDLSVLRIIDTDMSSKQGMSHAISLQSELESLADDYDDSACKSVINKGNESIEDMLFIKNPNNQLLTPKTSAFSWPNTSRDINIQSEAGITIFPNKIIRKPPPEEYFLLTVQAVKMNSPYADKGLNLNTQELYYNAVEEGIPFHKWHVWIESQLNQNYVQGLYKKSSKSIWKRFGKKMCF